ncbi:HNH endonuclease [Streptococcus suis]|uniref:Phage terminase n=1 Tax=Streptococcus suis TaxID=1307 RepID=A0A123VFN7_STRSU|nr:HNH endonuclease [Streptococcus suis]MCG9925546.1 HNH endonuclease [Streptococcus suis]MCG9927554.1 HNH endonuclease [Streptococcus suis]CYX44282.1 phage terminase [Streptococcus suis]
MVSIIAKYTYWLTEEGLLLIEGWARDGLTDKQIAHNIGIAEQTLNVWKKQFSSFSESLKRGKEVTDRIVENAMLKKIQGYDYWEVTEERILDTGQKKRHDNLQSLTEKEWNICLAYFGHRCAYCAKTENMTKDHLDPLQNGGELSFSNVVPACKSCNSSKKDNQWLSWYQKQDFYNHEKARKITDYTVFALGFPKSVGVDGELVVTKRVKKHVPADTTAMIFWLKNRKPDLWRDKREHDVSHSGAVSVNNPFDGLTTEELRKLVDDG